MQVSIDYSTTTSTTDTMAAPEENVSAEFKYVLHDVKIRESNMAYVDTGHSTKDTTVILIHGNPTSSYLWRNVIPHIESAGYRCVAPDLIGMGHSGKPDIEYRLQDHLEYFDEFMDIVLPSNKLVIVGQDWGSALGLDWASRYPQRVEGLVLMEWVFPAPSWDEKLPAGPARQMFQAFRDPERGRKLIIDDNVFIEQQLPHGQVRPMTQAEHDYYRQPYLEPKSREPIYRWPNEIPIEGQPADVYERSERYDKWLHETSIPKLIFWATPGRILTPDQAEDFVAKFHNANGIHLGQGTHNFQEDHPRRIGQEIFKWLSTW